MEDAGRKVEVYHATPLCGKCRNGIEVVKRVAARESAGFRVERSILKRIFYGFKLMNMPVVVIDGRSFSVLGAFDEDALSAELRPKSIEAGGRR